MTDAAPTPEEPTPQPSAASIPGPTTKSPGAPGDEGGPLTGPHDPHGDDGADTPSVEGGGEPSDSLKGQSDTSAAPTVLKNANGNHVSRNGRRLGRPSRLDPKVRDMLVQATSTGAPVRSACLAVGVDEATFYRWMEKGESPDSPREYRDFREEIQRARARRDVSDATVIARAAQTDWRAASYRQERLNPATWGRKDRMTAQVEHSGEVRIIIEDVEVVRDD